MSARVFFAELEELLLSLKQVRGCLSDQQSQNDIELVLALLNKVTYKEVDGESFESMCCCQCDPKLGRNKHRRQRLKVSVRLAGSHM